MTPIQDWFKQTEIWLIPEDWEVVELGEISNITKLSWFEFTKSIKYIDDWEIIALRALNVKKWKLDLTDIKRISKKSSEWLIRSKLIYWDILLTYTWSQYWEIALINENNKYHLAPNVCRARIDNLESIWYIYQYLRSDLFRTQMQNYWVGSSQPTIPMMTIRKLQIPLPPLPEQKAIAEILSSLDDKIELLEKQNKTLENIGQALFKSWFVDFEPFQNDLVESEMGMIPRGWKVGKVGDFADLDRGISYRSENLQEDWIPMINLWSFNLSWWIKNAWTKFYKWNYKENHIINNWEIIIASTDITQNRAILWKAFILPSDFSQPTVWSLDTLIFRNKSNISNYFFYYLMNTSDYRWFVESYATWTSIIRISKNAILDYVFVVPSLDILEDFDLQIKFIYKKIENNNLQIQTLSNLRDNLLPRLMSGKIRTKI